jgi:hypothetical protein
MGTSNPVEVQVIAGGVRGCKHDGVRLVPLQKPTAPKRERARSQLDELKSEIARLEGELGECQAVADRLRQRFGLLRDGLSGIRRRLPPNFGAKRHPSLLLDLDEWIQFAAANEVTP